MNLTWELRQGSVGRWVRHTLPGVGELEAAWRSGISSVSTRRPQVAADVRPEWAVLGTAIHHRVALGFGSDPPIAAFRGLAALTGLGAGDVLVEAYRQGHSPGADPTPSSGTLDFASRLGRFVARYDLAAPQPQAVERTLAKALWVLALWKDSNRETGPAAWCTGPAAATRTASDWLALAPDYAVADIAAVAHQFTTRGRCDLVTATGSDDAVVGPVYAPDWADADLKLGSCIIDMKATVDPRRLNPVWIWHLCCCAWLDGHADTIAIHLSRQARTITMDLAATVEAVSGGADAAVIAGQGRVVMREAAAGVGKPIL